MDTFVNHVIEKAQASVWTTPALFVVLAITFSQCTLALDDRFLNHAGGWFFISTSENATTLLSTIASSSLSLAGLSFSSIMVTMSLASGQFGPRLLRNFMKDRTTGFTLGTLMGTYTYCLFIIRGPHGDVSDDFVPQISTFLAVVGALASLVVFIHFVQHILIIIQAENVIADTHDGLLFTIKQLFPEMDKEEPEEDYKEPDEDLGKKIPANKFGYIQAVSLEQLVLIATQNDLVLYLRARAGHFVTSTQTVLQVIQSPNDDDLSDVVVRQLQACFYVDRVRTSEQDYEYGFRQLVEIALRALSPGINDPYTAVDCIDYLGSGLIEAFSRKLPQAIYRDGDNKIRLIRNVTTYRGLLCVAIDQVRQASKSDCAVSSALLEMLCNLASCAQNDDQRRAIFEQATLIKSNTLPAMLNDHDDEAITTRFEKVARACRLQGPVVT